MADMEESIVNSALAKAEQTPPKEEGEVVASSALEENILSKGTQILLLHGEKDNIVNAKESRIAFKIFVDLGYKTDIHVFKGGHKVPLKAKKLIQEKIFTNI